MSTTRRTALMLIPLGIAGAAGFAFYKMLDRMQTGKFDPHAMNNPLVGKPFPEFALKGLGDYKGFSSQDLRQAAAGKPVLVNFYASWCVPCASEADILAGLAAEGVPLWGVAYKDTVENSEKYLKRYGNPYARIADDADGRVAIDWGLYGVPETYLIDRAGIIRWHIAGPLTPEGVQDDLRPALKSVA
jgi:cytochrome c biogenesis protein CcmG/thiol:disulfide interchange protein DsbE